MSDVNIKAVAFLQSVYCLIPLRALPAYVNQPEVATTTILVKSVSGRGEWNITKRDSRGEVA